MRDRVQCEFFLIRYVPDVVKGEFANIGVLLREAGRDDSAVVRFTRDWSRVKCMDADADIGLLEALEGRLAPGCNSLGRTRRNQACDGDFAGHSGKLGADDRGKSLSGGEPAAEIEQLMKMYVEPFEGEDGEEANRAGSDCGGDADRV